MKRILAATVFLMGSLYAFAYRWNPKPTITNRQIDATTWQVCAFCPSGYKTMVHFRHWHEGNATRSEALEDASKAYCVRKGAGE